MARRPGRCSGCGSSRVAEILWGLPYSSKKLQCDLDQGTFVLGGCCVTDNDPSWKCLACEYKWGRMNGSKE